LEAFRINLKAFLGLVLPNQYSHIVMEGILAGFKVDFLRSVPHNFQRPYYESLLWFMIPQTNNLLINFLPGQQILYVAGFII